VPPFLKDAQGCPSSHSGPTPQPTEEGRATPPVVPGAHDLEPTFPVVRRGRRSQKNRSSAGSASGVGRGTANRGTTAEQGVSTGKGAVYACVDPRCRIA
jgi:hypothetical protein